MQHEINKLYYGDCLDVMKNMHLESVDLIYLDPPFNSNRAYNAIYKDETGRELPDQVEAFCDVWTMTAEREEQIRQFKIQHEEDMLVGNILELWKGALRGSNEKLLAYLFYMAERLLIMKRIMKPTASIYLHCDPTASHYIKPIMDAIFGHKNFRNELIWRYSTFHSSKKAYKKNYDQILFYTKGDGYTFNWDAVAEPYDELTIKRYDKTDEDGRYKLVKGRKYYMGIGTPPNSSFFMPQLQVNAKERLGYPTQKPVALLKRIILASSNEGDVVLDPFCGCATTIEAAERLKRRWIGIDIAFHAIKRAARARLQDRCRLIEDTDYKIEGIPRTLEGAQDLWERDKYHFQKWAVEQVGGFVTTRKTADRGIDGRLYFKIKDDKKHYSMVLEVKGGANVSASVVRDLRGVMEREHDSLMAGLIVMDDLPERKKHNFLQEMATAGQLEEDGRTYDRMQILSINDILEGKRFNTPYVEGKGSGQGVFSITNNTKETLI